jgi:hypothetical protein
LTCALAAAATRKNTRSLTLRLLRAPCARSRAACALPSQEAQFLEGASDAFHAVNELWPASDAAALAPLTSRAVGGAFADAMGVYAQEGLHVTFRVAALHRARVVSAALLFADEVGDGDGTEAAAGGESGAGGADGAQGAAEGGAAAAEPVRNSFKGRPTGVVGQVRGLSKLTSSPMCASLTNRAPIRIA